MIKFLKCFAIFILATVAHWIAVELFSPLGVTVGVMFVFSLIMACALSELGGYIFAFISGLFLDFFGTMLFGANALVFTLMLFLFYRIDDKIDFKDIGPQFVITVCLNIFCVLTYGVLGFIFSGVFIWQGFKSLIFGSLLSGLLLPAAYLLVTKYFAVGKLTNENK